MLYSEFIDNTGLPETDDAYRLYVKLNDAYMEDDFMTKEMVYKMGREYAKALDQKGAALKQVEAEWVVGHPNIAMACILRCMSDSGWYRSADKHAVDFVTKRGNKVSVGVLSRKRQDRESEIPEDGDVLCLKLNGRKVPCGEDGEMTITVRDLFWTVDSWYNTDKWFDGKEKTAICDVNGTVLFMDKIH